MRIYSFLATLALFPAFLSSLASSQSITGSLEGRVTDRSGAVIAGASLNAVNTETGLVRSTVTNNLGDYRIVQLPVGNYKVTAEAASFKTQSGAVKLRLSRHNQAP